MTSQEEQFRQLQADIERQAHPPSPNADEIDRTRPFTAELKVTLCGRDFPLKPTGGLITLFRYVMSGTREHPTATAKGMAQMAAMYTLLQDSVAAKEWDAFERHATRQKIGVEDLEPCIRQLIEAYTARPFWAGLRLLTTAAIHMADLDGAVLMGTGRGIATFTAREVCNLMLHRLLAAQPGEDERELFLEDLYLDWSPEQVALDQVAQMMAAKKQRAEEEAARGSGTDGEPETTGSPEPGDGSGVHHDPGAGPGTEDDPAEEEEARAAASDDGNGAGSDGKDSAEAAARRQRFLDRLAEGGEDRGVELPAGRPADSEPG